MNNKQVKAIKAVIKDMQQESRLYYYAEYLPSRPRLVALFQEYTLDEKKFTPIELFFIAESFPELRKTISHTALQQAYCTALQQLPADWWGEPRSMKTAASQHLLEVPGIEHGLKELLLVTTPRLSYIEGESNTMSIDLTWQRGDLAAGLIAILHKKEFDAFAPLEERLEVRKVWKRL